MGISFSMNMESLTSRKYKLYKSKKYNHTVHPTKITKNLCWVKKKKGFPIRCDKKKMKNKNCI